MKKVFSISFACSLLLILLYACAAPPSAPNCAEVENFCVGLVGEVGKINDQSLNQLAWEGAKRAEDKLGVYAQYIETVDSRDYEKNIAAFANAGYDLIITVGYAQRKATIEAAARYPRINFIGVDQPLDPDKALPQNLAGLAFAEDQLGFLAGALAAQMSKTHKVGAVCGPDTFPPAWRYCEGFKAGVGYINSPPTPQPTEEPTDEPPTSDESPSNTGEDPDGGEPTEEPGGEEPTEEPVEEPTEEASQMQLVAAKKFPVQKPAAQEELTPTPTVEEPPSDDTGAGDTTTSPTVQVIPVEALVSYNNEAAFGETVADPEWDALAANGLIDAQADIIFGADSYGENGAVSAAAKRRIYAIGVNIDQYYTVRDAQSMLLTSVVKRVAGGVFDLIRAARYGKFPSGNVTGAVGYAPYHDLTERVPDAITEKLAEIAAGIVDGSIETGVLWSKP